MATRTLLCSSPSFWPASRTRQLRLPPNASKGSSGVIAGIKEWVDKFKSGDYGKPPPTNFSKEIGAEIQARAPRPEDALVKVGNFLGSSRGVLNNAQAMLTQHAANTATNTQQCAQYLRIISDNSKNPAANAPAGGALATVWPSN